MTMKKKWAVCLILAGWALSSSAQDNFQIGLNFMVGIPQNEFADHVDNNGYGGSGYFTYRIPNTPIQAGAAIGFLIYGSDTREVPWGHGIPVWVDVTTTNSILSGHLFARIQPTRGIFRPYLEGLYGFNYLSTRTTIENQEESEDDDEIASSTNYDDAAGSYGYGGGVMLRVYQAKQDQMEGAKSLGIWVDFGIRSMKGGKAEYLKKGSITEDENGHFVYDVQRSTTDLLTWHLGVVFTF
ncbi:hypothetical protein JW906_09210 [bacterium]|nr:hypothetical protein [bacterium]